jgi:hypothetical protein
VYEQHDNKSQNYTFHRVTFIYAHNAQTKQKTQQSSRSGIRSGANSTKLRPQANIKQNCMSASRPESFSQAVSAFMSKGEPRSFNVLKYLASSLNSGVYLWLLITSSYAQIIARKCHVDRGKSIKGTLSKPG